MKQSDLPIALSRMSLEDGDTLIVKFTESRPAEVYQSVYEVLRSNAPSKVRILVFGPEVEMTHIPRMKTQ